MKANKRLIVVGANHDWSMRDNSDEYIMEMFHYRATVAENGAVHFTPNTAHPSVNLHDMAALETAIKRGDSRYEEGWLRYLILPEPAHGNAISGPEVLRRAQSLIIKKCVKCGNVDLFTRGQPSRCPKCSGTVRAKPSEYTNRKLNRVLDVLTILLVLGEWFLPLGSYGILWKTLIAAVLVALSQAARRIYAIRRQKADEMLSDKPVDIPEPSRARERGIHPQPNGTCECCGRPLAQRTITKNVVRHIDGTRRVERPVDVVQVLCEQCDVVVNDDLHGAIQEATTQLAQIVPNTQDAAKHGQLLDEILRHVRDLDASADAEINADFDSVRRSWDAAKVLAMTDAELRRALAGVIESNAQEGYAKIKIDVKDRKYVQVNALGAGWRPYRIWKNTGGTPSLYGHVTLYRFTGNA